MQKILSISPSKLSNNEINYICKHKKLKKQYYKKYFKGKNNLFRGEKTKSLLL